MIQPFFLKQASSTLPTPVSAGGRAPAYLSTVGLNPGGTSQTLAEFVTIMAETMPAPPVTMANLDRQSGTASREENDDLAASVPALRPPDPRDHSAIQGEALAASIGGSTGPETSPINDTTGAALAPAAGLTAPLLLPGSSRIPQETSITAKPQQAVSLAAMAFADQSAVSQPSLGMPSLVSAPIDDPTIFRGQNAVTLPPSPHQGSIPGSTDPKTFSAEIEPELAQGAGQRAAFMSSPALTSAMPMSLQDMHAGLATDAAAKPHAVPKQQISQAPIAGADKATTKPQPIFSELGLPSAEWLAQNTELQIGNGSKLAEMRSVLHEHKILQPAETRTPFSHFVPAGVVSQAPPAASPRLLAGEAGVDSVAAPEPMPNSAAVRLDPTLPSQVVQPVLRPGADSQNIPARVPMGEHPSAWAFMAPEGPLTGNGTVMTMASGPTESLHFFTYVAESRVYATDQDPASPGLIAVAAETGFRSSQDDPSPLRVPAIPTLLTAEVLRFVQLTPDGPVTLTLRPDELGTLRFEVTRTEHGLHIHLSVEEPQTLDLLRRQGDQLLADLRQAGFAGASLSFAGGGAQDAPPQQGEQPQDRTYVPATAPMHDHLSPQLRPMLPLGTLDLRL